MDGPRGLTFDTENQHSTLTFLKLFIVLIHTLSVNRFECLPPFITQTKTQQTQTEGESEYQVEMRWWSKVTSFFFFFPSLHLQWPSNSPSSEPWSSDSSNHNPLKMSLSPENGSMQKSIKGFNVAGLPWLPRLLSAIHQVTLFHSLLLVSARPKTGREHYV